MSAIVISAALIATVAMSEPVPVTPPVPAPAPVQILDIIDVLVWLTDHQEPDGSWAPRIGADPGTEPRIEATAKALLAFAGAGFGPYEPSRYRDAIHRGTTWLDAHPVDRAGATRIAAWRAMILAEQHGMSAKGRQEALAAVQDLLSRRLGPGWAEVPGGTVIDSRTTALGVMALKSAIAAGLDEAREPMALLKAWAMDAWGRRTGPGFPARTREDGTAIGTGSADGAGMVAALFSKAMAEPIEPAWRDLADRGTSGDPQAPTAGDPVEMWITRLNAFQVGGVTWQRYHEARKQVDDQVQAFAAAGDIDGFACAAITRMVHYRWDALHVPAPKVFKINGMPSADFHFQDEEPPVPLPKNTF